MVSMVYYTDEIVQVLVDQYKGFGKPLLFLLHGLNTDSNNFSKPAEFEVLHLILYSTFICFLPFEQSDIVPQVLVFFSNVKVTELAHYL